MVLIYEWIHVPMHAYLYPSRSICVEYEVRQIISSICVIIGILCNCLKTAEGIFHITLKFNELKDLNISR